MPRVRVQVRDLQPGDITTGSKQRIVRVTTSAVGLPTGKVDVVTQRVDSEGRPKGEAVARRWGRYTELTVARLELLPGDVDIDSVPYERKPCPYGQDGEPACCGSPGVCQGPLFGHDRTENI